MAKYIDENIGLTPNSNWTIYEGPNGLTYTKDSMKYWDEDYKEVMSFMTMDEVPEDIEALIDSVEFQMKQNLRY